MSRSYLDLCRAFVAELGIAGGTGPTAVTGQTSELGNVVRWIADADVEILNKWQDWKFLWTSGPVAQQLIALADTITTITDLGTEVEDGLLMDINGLGWRPKWMSWHDFNRAYKTNEKKTLLRPTAWTVRPDGIIELSHRVQQVTPWTLEYHKRPARLTSNLQTSPIPEHMDRIILARAALMYAGREDAPEIAISMGAEYDDMLVSLENMYLPALRNHGRSRNNGLPEPDFLG